MALKCSTKNQNWGSRDPVVGPASAAAKFGLEGGLESLTPEPGFFCTELLTSERTSCAQPEIGDYVERTGTTTGGGAYFT